MKRLLVVVMMILHCFSFGQASNWIWGRQASGNGVQEGMSIAGDSFGNYYATGSYDSIMHFGSIIIPNAGHSDMFLVKYDGSGNVIWARSAGGISYDSGNSVTIDFSGNVYVTGFFLGTTIIFDTDTVTTTGGGAHMFIAKYSAAGNILWANCTRGVSDNSFGHSVITDGSGNVFVTGYFEGANLIVGNDTLTNVSPPQNDIFLIKFSNLGTILWAKSAGGLGDDKSYSTTIDLTGNVYITGNYQFYPMIVDSDTLSYAGDKDIFIAKYSTGGSLLWAKGIGGSYNDEGNSVATDISGNVYLTGYFGSQTIVFGSDTLTNSGGTDIYIVKFSSSGNILLTKSAKGNNYDAGFFITTDASGVYLTGGFNSSFISFASDTVFFPTGGTDPMFIVKFDSNLNVICASELASGGDDQNALITDSFGNIYIAGDLETNTIIIGGDTLSMPPNSEIFFIAKYFCAGGNIVKEIINQETITISPNPFSSQTTITFSSEQKNTTIKVISVLGETIQQITTSNKQLTLDMTGYARGIYFVRIEENGSASSPNNVVNKKIVVQ